MSKEKKMVKAANSERREHVRAKRVLSVEYKLSKSRRKHSDKNTYVSTTQDMSIGGISFYSEKQYAMGDVLEIHVVMSGVLDIFSGLAKVVRAEKKKTGTLYLIGVKFLKSPARKRRAKLYGSSTTRKKPSRSKKRIL